MFQSDYLDKSQATYPSESSQANDHKRKLPSERSHAKFPKQIIPNESYRKAVHVFLWILHKCMMDSIFQTSTHFNVHDLRRVYVSQLSFEVFTFCLQLVILFFSMLLHIQTKRNKFPTRISNLGISKHILETLVFSNQRIGGI